MTNDAIHRIHFIGDFTSREEVYECQRCGCVCATTRDVYVHRRGVVSACDRARFAAWLRGLW